jgi:hypothetical protein
MAQCENRMAEQRNGKEKSDKRFIANMCIYVFFFLLFPAMPLLHTAKYFPFYVLAI